MRSRDTQRGRILHLLESRRGEWVPSYELSDIALQYGARVLELRRAGYQIENKAQHVNGEVHGAFRLVLPKEQGRLFPKPELEEGQHQHYLEVQAEDLSERRWEL